MHPTELQKPPLCLLCLHAFFGLSGLCRVEVYYQMSPGQGRDACPQGIICEERADRDLISAELKDKQVTAPLICGQRADRMKIVFTFIVVYCHVYCHLLSFFYIIFVVVVVFFPLHCFSFDFPRGFLHFTAL